MTRGAMILGIALFALAGAVLYVWGLKKADGQQEELQRRLMSACGSRVLRQLKRQETVTEAEIASLIEGVTVGPVWSRRRLHIQSGKKAAGQVIAFLLDQQYIQPDGRGAYRRKM